MFPEGAVIKCFVIKHKQNIPQLLNQNKFVTRMIVHDRNNATRKNLVNDTNFKICIFGIKAKELLRKYRMLRI